MKICPYCGKEIQGNHHIYANHIRWCKSNPKYNDIKKSTIEKNSIKHNKKHIFNLKCIICGNDYNICTTDYKYSIGKYKKTCCDECSKKLTVLNTNNEEKCSKIKNTYKQKYKENKKKYKKICDYCGGEFETNKIGQKFCCISCARKKQVKDKSNLKKIYRQQCNFKFGLKDFSDLFDFDLLEKYGMYKASNRGNNPNGISRDHMISVNYGFNHNIDPYIISHPMNCRLMHQLDNFKKLDNCSMSLTELIERINNFDEIYGTYPNKIDYSLLKDYNIIYKI